MSSALSPVTLVLGGARSGKSAFSERLAAPSRRPVYLATAEPRDEEMAERIRRHRLRRGPRWTTVEEPLDIAPALQRWTAADAAVVVDCLTLWLSNVMHVGRDPNAEMQGLLETIRRLRGPVVFVSNEVGWGIVPENRLARQFRDRIGRLHQALAETAGQVYLVVAGLPLLMKSEAADAVRKKT